MAYELAQAYSVWPAATTLGSGKPRYLERTNHVGPGAGTHDIGFEKTSATGSDPQIDPAVERAR